MNKSIIVVAILATAFTLASCKDDPDVIEDSPIEDPQIENPQIEEADSSWYPLTTKYQNSHLYSVCFVTENIGYIAGEDGLIIKTTNGGLDYNWIEQTSGVTVDLTGLCFVDENTGFARSIVDNTFLRTTDGGSTWQNQAIDDNVIITDMQFVDASTGFAIGRCSESGVIYKTTNTGQTWQQVYTHEERFLGLSFANGNKGVALCNDGYIVQTDDGGNTWDYRHVSTKPLISVSLVNENVGYAVGSGEFDYADAVLKTIDGGQTWNIVSDTTTEQHFNMVTFISETEGYATTGRILTMGDYLLKTTDGGETWTGQFHSANIMSVSFVNDQTGYFVAGRDAGNPNIFKTRTGGE